MSKPSCPLHPHGRVRRQGRYGKNKQYQRWQCVPANGDAPHLCRPILPLKSAGGVHGECVECERHWHPGEGMPSAVLDRFSIREKTSALVKLAEGASYRHASQQARVRAQEFKRGPRDTLIASRDGRLGGDWVSQYAPILAEKFLPKAWPEVLVLDHLSFHLRDRASGRPKQSGRVGFHVLAALSYGDGTVVDAYRLGREPMLWRLAAFSSVAQDTWQQFFRQLPGRPLYVVSDRHAGMLNALAAEWPGTAHYPCTQHLRMNVETILRDGDLRGQDVATLVREKTFVRHADYDALIAEVARLHTDKDAWESLSRKQRDGANRLDAWLWENGPAIERSIREPHAPLTVGGLENPLYVIKNALKYRRKVLRNLKRLNHLLVLLQLKQNGKVNERAWAQVIRRQHERTNGHPPPRRTVDDSALRPR